MMAVCDKDCFNCPYEDCINDQMDHENYRESAAREKELFMTPKKRKIAAGKKAYREANREKYNAYMREYKRKRRACNA